MNSLLNNVIFLAAAVSLTETVAQAAIKRPEDGLLLGATFYNLVVMLLYYTYKSIPLSKFNTIWSSMSIVIATLLGYFVYNEKINHNNLISVLFALLAIYFSNI